MRPLVNANLIVSSNANGNAVRNFVESRINQLGPGFALTEPVLVKAPPGNRLLVNFTVLCATEPEAEQLFDDIVAAWTSGAQANRIQPGSSVKRTRNYDDEGNGQPDEIMETATKA